MRRKQTPHAISAEVAARLAATSRRISERAPTVVHNPHLFAHLVIIYLAGLDSGTQKLVEAHELDAVELLDAAPHNERNRDENGFWRALDQHFPGLVEPQEARLLSAFRMYGTAYLVDAVASVAQEPLLEELEYACGQSLAA